MREWIFHSFAIQSFYFRNFVADFFGRSPEWQITEPTGNVCVSAFRVKLVVDFLLVIIETIIASSYNWALRM